MRSVHALKGELVAFLERDMRFREVELLPEFPAASRVYPVKKPRIAVGIAGVELAPAGLGGYLGQGPDRSASLYGRMAKVTVYFDVHAPQNQGGQGCHDLYEALCDVLVLGESPFGFTRMWSGRLEGDTATGSNRLRVWARLEGAVAYGDESLAVSGFQVKRQEESG